MKGFLLLWRALPIADDATCIGLNTDTLFRTPQHIEYPGHTGHLRHCWLETAGRAEECAEDSQICCQILMRWPDKGLSTQSDDMSAVSAISQSENSLMM